MLRFIVQMESEYALPVQRISDSGKNFKGLLQQFVDMTGAQAIFLGVRRGDPGGKIAHFAESDPGWPQITRISPVLNWTHEDIWEFFLRFDLPFCSLYNEGYTSLGATGNTWRHPLLRNITDISQAPWLDSGAAELRRRGLDMAELRLDTYVSPEPPMDHSSSECVLPQRPPALRPGHPAGTRGGNGVSINLPAWFMPTWSDERACRVGSLAGATSSADRRVASTLAQSSAKAVADRSLEWVRSLLA
jgi:hypothetical protein